MIAIICIQIIVYIDQQGKYIFCSLTLDHRVLLYCIILYNLLMKYLLMKYHYFNILNDDNVL